MSVLSHADGLIEVQDDLIALEKVEKKVQDSYDRASQAVKKAEKKEKTGAQIDVLKKDQFDEAFKVQLAGLVAEETSDKRDEVMKIDLRLHNKRGEIIILGLDGAGKTTLLRTLKDDPRAQYISNLYSTSEELMIGNIKFVAFNLGGSHAQADRVWKDYFPVVDSIVLLVDATDRRRFTEAKAELNNLAMDDQIVNARIVILGTKNDQPEAVSEQTLRAELGISLGIADRGNINGRRVEVFMCNLKNQRSFGAAFRYLAHFLEEI